MTFASSPGLVLELHAWRGRNSDFIHVYASRVTFSDSMRICLGPCETQKRMHNFSEQLLTRSIIDMITQEDHRQYSLCRERLGDYG